MYCNHYICHIITYLSIKYLKYENIVTDEIVTSGSIQSNICCSPIPTWTVSQTSFKQYGAYRRQLKTLAFLVQRVIHIFSSLFTNCCLQYHLFRHCFANSKCALFTCSLSICFFLHKNFISWLSLFIIHASFVFLFVDYCR